MALAKIAPEADQRGRGKNSKILEFSVGSERKVMQEAVRRARAVLRFTPAVAEEVLSGMLQLDPAYKDAMGGDDRKKANQSMALALQARGLTHRQIAKQLRVAHITVGRWLEHFGSAPESFIEPELPDARRSTPSPRRSRTTPAAACPHTGRPRRRACTAPKRRTRRPQPTWCPLPYRGLAPMPVPDSVKIAGRKFAPGLDRSVETLMTATSRVLQRCRPRWSRSGSTRRPLWCGSGTASGCLVEIPAEQ